MSVEIFAALVAFSFASSVTPGPNNLMLLASGVNFGFRRTIPHMLGVGAGFALLLICVGLGLGQLLERAPTLELALKIAGVGYLLWLAWKIANSGPVESREAAPRPMNFLEAVAFQWVNPKAWLMAMTAMTAYASADPRLVSVFLVTAVFAVVNVPSIALWCGLGAGMRDFLADPGRLRLFNWTMAALLVVSLWPMLS
jgi:threonine/homoserine/homoserine lactone efflux protein